MAFLMNMGNNQVCYWFHKSDMGEREYWNAWIWVFLHISTWINILDLPDMLVKLHCWIVCVGMLMAWEDGQGSMVRRRRVQLLQTTKALSAEHTSIIKIPETWSWAAKRFRVLQTKSLESKSRYRLRINCLSKPRRPSGLLGQDMEECQFKSCLLHFWSSWLLIHLEKQWKIAWMEFQAAVAIWRVK